MPYEPARRTVLGMTGIAAAAALIPLKLKAAEEPGMYQMSQYATTQQFNADVPKMTAAGFKIETCVILAEDLIFVLWARRSHPGNGR